MEERKHVMAMGGNTSEGPRGKREGVEVFVVCERSGGSRIAGGRRGDVGGWGGVGWWGGLRWV